ncbi:MAG: CBS domain-containing protein [Anaerolineales bacterium]|nr:CBS domain-containing protein [Anaerolineales bacterium]
MHIILTHEQSDFDAIASLLGAHLMDEATIPVLPRKMNRNVRAFLILYDVDLPFVDPRDLPNDSIEAVTLVDTQSLISVKGMSENTHVRVIDHHPLREELPIDWMITVSGTGANTTLFVEIVRERDLILSTVQATLLLLGIYEDTGSLTYDRTTARDLRAAGYLLEQGASLHIASDFLNHPLSNGQQIIYDQLRESIEHVHIYGNTVIIACGDASSLDEELSTIAHKLRDLLDPDALFLLVTTRGGVQLIARSTSDNIDVADVAAHFGGGGHERAAAGLIKDRDIEDVRAELVRILSEFIHPSITVTQIMSRGPQLLTPATPVDEAARYMQRFGYEGYPVVGDGKVVGLLTRRAVDRALSHKLKLTAASLMEAGEYTVHPDDSIEHLQHIMTESGWGQIPVVEPDSGEIIGIVTRTDLLKTLTSRPKIPGRQNLADKLESALTTGRVALIKAVAEIAHQQRAALYIVGGFVRDLLLDRPSQDFDLVVEGDAISLARALARKYGGRVTSHARFGTAKWLLNQPETGESDIERTAYQEMPVTDINSLDLVSARTEFYPYPTALPTVERGSIKLDLHRRDFTFNTLAVRLDGRHYGELHDYWGGLIDLRHGQVRVLHSLSFVDDPTRILRAIRFEQRFSFLIEERTLELLKEATSLLDRVSGDRIRHELDHILIEERAPQMLARLNELDLLKAIHPQLTWDGWIKDKLDSPLILKIGSEWELPCKNSHYTYKRDIIYILWMLRLEYAEARNIIKRLKLSSELSKTILAACQLWDDLAELEGNSPSEVVNRLDDVPRLALYSIYIACEQHALQKMIYAYVTEWRNITPKTRGDDLKAIGLPPGPVYRFILEELQTAWLDGVITTEEQEMALLERLIAEQENSGGSEG